MPYILKNKNGTIKAISQTEMKGSGWEACDGSSAEYLSFLEDAIAKQDKFRASDIGLARVLEDLIDLLIERDYIRFTDFPDAAQKRLVERQTIRKSSVELDLVDTEDDLV